ncbi:MAG: LysR family transcriptional regulator [Gammaproteobacteria bacterium]|nr:LysR family transcriptional regulator [Gammaproteobacteria bacterium]
MLDLNEVRMFVQVVRARSFAEAARRLNVPPNTLSRRIRRLESRLDTRLMQRSTRKLTLTPAGHAFFDRCAAAVDGVLEAGKDLVDGASKPSGTVRIAAPADFLDLFRIDWVAEFLVRHPQIRLDFVLSDARADLIEEGIDVALRGGTSRDTRAAFRQITSQYFSLVASPRYLAARGTPHTLQELAQHDCLTVSSRQTHVTWTLQGPQGDEEVKVSGRFSANSTRILMQSCVSGLGIAMLPTMLIVSEFRAGRLVHVLPAYRRDGADFNILLPSRQQIPTAVLAFVEFATARLRAMVSDEAAFSSPARRRTRSA